MSEVRVGAGGELDSVCPECLRPLLGKHYATPEDAYAALLRLTDDADFDLRAGRLEDAGFA